MVPFACGHRVAGAQDRRSSWALTVAAPKGLSQALLRRPVTFHGCRKLCCRALVPAARVSVSVHLMHSALRILLRLAVAFGVLLLVPQSAFASGHVSLATREPVEADGKWKLQMTIDYGSIPQIPHVPMIFVFVPTVLYERALTDKSPDTPILNRIPLQNQQPINESLDVGFANAMGKVFKVTKFDFVIRRDHGFEAGEYELKIKREDDGVAVGQPFHLTLKGDNAVVDRRAIVFAGEKKPKKADADKVADATPKKDSETSAPGQAADSDSDAGQADAPAPPPVPPMQGGCGCRLASGNEPASPLALASLAFGVALLARRRR